MSSDNRVKITQENGEFHITERTAFNKEAGEWETNKVCRIWQDVNELAYSWNVESYRGEGHTYEAYSFNEAMDIAMAVAYTK